MNVPLTPEFEKLVHDKIDAGHYGSASEVLSEALRLLSQRDRILELSEPDIRAKIAAGVASLQAGRTVDGEGVFDRIDAELAAAEGQANE